MGHSNNLINNCIQDSILTGEWKPQHKTISQMQIIMLTNPIVKRRVALLILVEKPSMLVTIRNKNNGKISKSNQEVKILHKLLITK